MSAPRRHPQVAVLAPAPLRRTLERCAQVATGGLPIFTANHPDAIFDELQGEVRLVLADRVFAHAILTRRSTIPFTRIAIVSPEVDDAMLDESLRAPTVIGFVGSDSETVRGWEIAYLVRRTLAQGQPPPSSAQLLSWGATSVTWNPKTTADRDQVVNSVELSCQRLGVADRLAAVAGDAAHELIMNAMICAPTDDAGLALYTDRDASVRLADNHAPRVTLTVDHQFVALDVVDPFGRLKRHELFGSLLRGRTRPLIDDAPRTGIGLFRLFRTATILRAEVQPRRFTSVSWMVDRAESFRDRQTRARSVYHVPDAPTSARLHQILLWASQHGHDNAVSRIRMRILPYALLEGVNLAEEGPQSEVSLELLERIRTAASSIVGRECPF